MAKDPIKKAENGTYYFRANLGFHPITGKQIQKYKSGFKTKKEAREAYSKLMLTSTEELTEKKQQLSFQQFIEETSLPWKKTQEKESPYLNRRSTIQKHFSYFYKMTVDEIEPINVQNWQLELAKEFSPNYIRIVQGMLSIAFDRAVVLGLAKKNPYKILNGARFYDSEEIRTVLAYLRMVYAPNDLDFLWTIKRPRKGFGKKSIEDLKKYAAEHEIGLFQALGEQIEQGIVKKEVIVTYYKNISELHKEYDKYSCKELVNRVLDFGYREELEQDVEQRRLDNVTELITAIAAMEAENQDKLSLEELLAYMERNDLGTLKASTQIMIAPLGYRWRIVRAIVTNFHQPKSTLLLLVSAYVGEDWHRIYDYALRNDFRFLSYGDSSLLVNDAPFAG